MSRKRRPKTKDLEKEYPLENEDLEKEDPLENEVLALVYMKRVKRDAMFRPSWKFEGKQNSIPAQFFVLCFRVFLGGLRFRGLRFLGGLRFRGLRFLGGVRFRGLRFLRGLPFRGLWSSVFGLRFLDTPPVTTPASHQQGVKAAIYTSIQAFAQSTETVSNYHRFSFPPGLFKK